METRIRYFVSFFSTLIMVSCGPGSESNSESNSLDTETKENNEIVSVSHMDKIKNLSGDTVVISVSEVITKEEVDDCGEWTLSNQQIMEILNLSEIIPYPGDLQYMYYPVPCHIEGQLQIGTDTFSFNVNGGSYLSIKNSDTTIYLGCASDECISYFIRRGGYIAEEEEE